MNYLNIIIKYYIPWFVIKLEMKKKINQYIIIKYQSC